MAPSRRFWYSYPTLLGETDDVTLQDNWLYFGRTPDWSRQGADTMLARRRFTLSRLNP
jgi:hypothetical protein